MKKFITTLSLILCLLLVCTACSCDASKNWKVGYAGGEVSSNGGFVVEVGEYVYFINGVANSTDANDFGTPIKGALVRMKKSELKNPTNTSAEVVIPKLFASSYYKAGVSIFNDHVYYASPNSETNKKGEVLNTQIVFHRTKLDGTNTINIVTCDAIAQEYKFISVGNEVYLITVTANSSGSSSGASTYALNVYNANSGAKIFTKENVDSYAIPNEMTVTDDKAYIFYTDLIVDENEQDKEYGAIYSYKLGETVEKIVISGETNKGPFGTKGYNFKVVKNANGILYFNANGVSGGEAGLLYYYVDVTAVGMLVEGTTDDEKAQFVTDNTANFNAKVRLTDVLGAYVASAMGANSIFASANSIIYFDSSRGGLYSYNYELDETSPANDKVIKGEGELLCATAKLNYNNTALTSPVFLTIVNNFAYFNDSSNFVYRIELGNANASLQKISLMATNTSWYAPEVVTVDGVDYLLQNVTAEPHNSYIYAFEADVEAKMIREKADELAEATDYQKTLDEFVKAYFQDVTDKKEDAISALIDRRIGVVTFADINATSAYMSSNYNSSSSSK